MRHLPIHRPARAGVIMLSCALISAVPTTAQIYVNASATGANDGTSWVNAFTDLQSALAVAVSGTEIWVAAGTYKPTTGSDRNATFQLKSGVGLYGGFAGTETSRAEGDWETNVTTLSGNHSFQVVTGSGTDSTAVLDGFVVTRGWGSLGGGMTNINGSPTIINVIFSSNYASLGGGMYNEAGSPTLENVVFSNNQAEAGGGMWDWGELERFPQSVNDIKLKNVTFSGNLGIFVGGGCSGCNGKLTNVSFIGNQSDGDDGGGGGCFGCSGTLTNVSFIGNGLVTVDGSGGGGGGCHGCNGTLTNVSFTSNWIMGGGPPAMYGGGCYGCNGTLTNVTFMRNRITEGNGGGCAGCNGTLTNVVFANNSASGYGLGLPGEVHRVGYGAGLFSIGNSALENVSFYANVSGFAEANLPGHGGGIFNSSGALTLVNCILWGNQANLNLTENEVSGEGEPPVISYSLIEGSGGSGAGWDTLLGTDGGNNIDADPLFVNPVFCENPWPPCPIPDLRLTLGSPAINVGNNAAIPPGVTTDLDGNPRIHCRVDMGAYESQFPDEIPPTITVTLSREASWPPNHKMSPITATVTPEDDCDPAPTFELVSITSNEPDNGTGDGDTINDIQGADIGTPDIEFQLRSERSGQGSGRIYTITYDATDESGNTDTVVCIRPSQGCRYDDLWLDAVSKLLRDS